MSGATVLVMYPRREGATFDTAYYLSTHVALVKKHWTKHGLRSYTVTQANPDGPYVVVVVLESESDEGFGAASQDPGSKELGEDVKNFTNLEPVFVHGAVIGRG